MITEKRRKMNWQKAEEKAKQDSEAAKETGTSKIKNEDMTSDTVKVTVTEPGKTEQQRALGQQIPGQQIPGQPELQDQKEPEHPDHQVRPEPRQRRKKSQYQLYGRQLHPVAGERSCDHELQHG